MGLFGIKTKKEKAAEAEKAKKAAEEEALIADIKYWPREQCKRELKAIEDGKRDYSYSVRSAIKSRHTHLCIEAGEDAKRREYDRKIAAQEKEISTLKGRSPWTVAGGAGGWVATRSTESDKKYYGEIDRAEQELRRLQRERDNVGKY